MSGDYGSRTQGQRIWLAGAAALLTVLVVGGGWLAWRGLDHAAPTLSAQSGQQSLVLDEGEVGFGAPQLIDGVPWGFPLTPEGAAAAAVSAVAVTGQANAVFDASRFEDVATVVFTANEAARQGEQVAAARAEFEVSGWGQQPASRRTYFLTPLAVRLVSFQPGPGTEGASARVEVWAMTLIGVGDAGGAVFTTSTVDLAAEGGSDSWKVTALDSSEGPVPMVAGTASAPGRTRAFVRDSLPTVPLPLPPSDRP